MSSILFWDPSCQRPYDTQSVRDEATGGSEASVSRIADALDAHVIQHNRVEPAGRYRPPGRIQGISHVVISRDPRVIPKVRALYPEARILLWVHDQIHPGSTRGRRLAQSAQVVRELAVGIVCVSDSQRAGVEATLQRMGVAGSVKARTIYNPVPDAPTPDGTLVDKDKLVFFSSPNKGLKSTLDAFRAARRRIPQLRLVVGNPGYKSGQFPSIDGVTYLGPQAPAVMHAQVSTALCTFCPIFVIPETFGLVFAESLALGTPVLTHDCGAAREVIGDPGQLLPVTIWHRAYEGVNGRFVLKSAQRTGPGGPRAWACSTTTSSGYKRGAPAPGRRPARIHVFACLPLPGSGVRCWRSNTDPRLHQARLRSKATERHASTTRDTEISSTRRGCEGGASRPITGVVGAPLGSQFSTTVAPNNTTLG